jgi:hypothetical protein
VIVRQGHIHNQNFGDRKTRYFLTAHFDWLHGMSLIADLTVIVEAPHDVHGMIRTIERTSFVGRTPRAGSIALCTESVGLQDLHSHGMLILHHPNRMRDSLLAGS